MGNITLTNTKKILNTRVRLYYTAHDTRRNSPVIKWNFKEFDVKLQCIYIYLQIREGRHTRTRQVCTGVNLSGL